MGLLEDLLAESGTETGVDPMSRMAADLILGQGESRVAKDASGLNRVLMGLAGMAESLGGGGGGPKGALNMLGPIARTDSRFINKAQKKIAKTLAMYAPELLKEAIASKRVLHIGAPQPIETAAKTATKAEGLTSTPEVRQRLMQEIAAQFPEYRNFGIYQDALNPSFGGTMSINPRMLRGLSPSGQRTSVTLPEVATHELTHFLTSPQTRALKPEQASEIGSALQRYLSPHGQETVLESVVKAALGTEGESEKAASEALSYLSESLLRRGSSREARDIFMSVRPELPRALPGTKGTAGGISGMGVENLPLHQTLKDLGVLKSPKGSLLQDVIDAIRGIYTGGE